jgi:excisionase family DNA binding protein
VTRPVVVAARRRSLPEVELAQAEPARAVNIWPPAAAMYSYHRGRRKHALASLSSMKRDRYPDFVLIRDGGSMTERPSAELLDRLAYSVDEAALLTGLSRDLLYDQMRTGKLVYLKVGRRRIITRNELQSFLTRAAS